MIPPWQPGRLLIVLDIGKSNAKIVLLDPLTGAELAIHRRPNAPVTTGPIRQLDLAGLQAWLHDTLAALPERARIGAIVPVAHGAACVMLDAAGTPLLAPDYEDPAFDDVTPSYEPLRDPFEETFSPSLPAGLNLGRQIHWTARRMPSAFDRLRTIIPYPQYWSFLLSGIASSEVTSLGCHTDLWRPGAGGFSNLAIGQGWPPLFAPLRRADERLGTLRPEIATRCGLPPDCAVLCGVHDSNASFLRHRMRRQAGEPFSVVSSGTWTITLAAGVSLETLRPERDMLANVDVFGHAVGTARFMGGREYEAVAGPAPLPPTERALHAVLAAGATVLPSLAVGGQFPHRPGAIRGAETLDAEQRAALASLYVAFLTDMSLDLLGAGGDIIVDGPLAENPLVPRILATFRQGSRVLLGDGAAGSVGGAICLLLGRPPTPTLREASVLPPPNLLESRKTWRQALN
jgi:sugar (pentulose or hexulose) kinase